MLRLRFFARGVARAVGVAAAPKSSSALLWSVAFLCFVGAVAGGVSGAIKVGDTGFSGPLPPWGRVLFGAAAVVLVGVGLSPHLAVRPLEFGEAPPSAASFTGRRRELRAIRGTVRRHGRAALTGLGGVGKTQLALAYVRRYQYAYDTVLFLRGGRLDLARSTVTLAHRLRRGRAHGEGAADEEVALGVVTDWLRHRTHWLLVVDDAEQPALLARRLLTVGVDRGHVLLTSRDDVGWGNLVVTYEVGVMPPAEAAELLRKTSGDGDRAAARELAERLGHLPLALTQAGTYVRSTPRSLRWFADRVREDLEAPLTKGPAPADYLRTVAVTFGLCLTAVEAESPQAADLVRLCAFLASDDIWPALVGTEGDEVAVLRRWSLVTVGRESFAMHPVVQAAVRQGLGEEARRRWRSRAVAAVVGVLDAEAYARLLPHALAAARYGDGAEPKAAGALRRWLGDYFLERADYQRAEEHLTAALQAHRAIEDDVAIADDLGLMSELWYCTGRYGAAEQAAREALRVADTGGADHAILARLHHRLGCAVRDQGRFAEALGVFEAGLATIDTALGRNESLSIDLEAEVVDCLRWLGRYDVAIPRMIALVGRARMGDERLLTSCLSELGLCLLNAGRPAEALPHLEEALDLVETHHGREHPSVGTALANVGLALRGMNDLPGSRARFERARSIFEARLGPDHPDLAGVLIDLAGVATQFQDYGVACDHCIEALRILSSRGLASHPWFGYAHERLAEAYGKLRQTNAERASLGAALEAFERAYGPDSKQAIRVRTLLDKLSHARRKRRTSRRANSEPPGTGI